MVPARCAAGSAATALVTALRALRFEGGAVEARFRRGYYASQLSTDVVFCFILLASQAPPAYLRTTLRSSRGRLPVLAAPCRRGAVYTR